MVESSSYERPTPVRFWYGAFGAARGATSDIVQWLELSVQHFNLGFDSQYQNGAASGAYRSHDVIVAYLFLTQEILVQVQMRPLIYRVLKD